MSYIGGGVKGGRGPAGPRGRCPRGSVSGGSRGDPPSTGAAGVGPGVVATSARELVGRSASAAAAAAGVEGSRSRVFGVAGWAAHAQPVPARTTIHAAAVCINTINLPSHCPTV